MLSKCAQKLVEKLSIDAARLFNRWERVNPQDYSIFTTSCGHSPLEASWIWDCNLIQLPLVDPSIPGTSWLLYAGLKSLVYRLSP